MRAKSGGGGDTVEMLTYILEGVKQYNDVNDTQISLNTTVRQGLMEVKILLPPKKRNEKEMSKSAG